MPTPSTIEETVLSQKVPGFRANLNLAPQQKESKLLGAVEADLNYSVEGDRFNADDIMPSEPEDNDTRVPDTPDKFPGYTRRIGFFRNFHDSAWLDTIDKITSITDPTSGVMQSLMAGQGRHMDRRIIADMLGSAYETPEGFEGAPTAVAFKSSQIVEADSVDFRHQDETVPDDDSDYGLGIGKLIEAKLRLDDSELEGERYFAHTPAQLADLLRRTPATSKYYSEVQALNEGKITRMLGFEFINLPRSRLPFLEGSTTVRSCVAWVKEAVIYKARSVEEATITKRADKSHTPQAYYRRRHGASRRYDFGVVRVDCLETAAKAT